ncbi:hypothetical protein Glove_353g29 [Diversispora epigaea]|uniref:Uncharacterized protein n=1 Tax=Diversispora epigaea TaxID=1348612 RepID=A0A397HEG2_9GLOM|nr:hypothetical protein Glove_353g29 [Diversispora epigaea]
MCYHVSIREGVKVSILGSVVSENIARPLLGKLWKTKRLSTTVLQIATGNNRWIICPNSQPEKEIEISAGRMKFVDFPTTSAGTNQNTRNKEGIDGSETNISSNTDSDSDEDREATNIRNEFPIYEFLQIGCPIYAYFRHQ